MAWARFLLESGETGEGVSSVLRDVIMDEPTQAEAVLLLADLHEKRGTSARRWRCCPRPCARPTPTPTAPAGRRWPAAWPSW
jgi:hypothetical protein